mmetsp:Transcript_27013/g.57839  ORF Transcript_27013/g.57839 Transcript_27013/m.57839 type:complete len:291 (+) Transcript_27013:134-1006(+)
MYLSQTLTPAPSQSPSSTPSRLLASSMQVQPTFCTVVIGKGKVPRKATGNRRLGSLVHSRLQEYVNAKSKMVKSSIVSEIYTAIKDCCFLEGGHPFVRYDGRCYTVVTESVAREKITSTFRDYLHDRYKSSSKNKVAKRRLVNEEKAKRKLRQVKPDTPPPLSSEKPQQQENKVTPQIPPSSSPLIPVQVNVGYISPHTMSAPAPYHQESMSFPSQRLPMGYFQFGVNTWNSNGRSRLLQSRASQIEASSEPSFDSIGPVDKSVFDCPFPEIDSVAASSKSTGSGDYCLV